MLMCWQECAWRAARSATRVNASLVTAAPATYASAIHDAADRLLAFVRDARLRALVALHTRRVHDVVARTMRRLAADGMLAVPSADHEPDVAAFRPP